jgi:hypothetical protein
MGFSCLGAFLPLEPIDTAKLQYNLKKAILYFAKKCCSSDMFVLKVVKTEGHKLTNS